MMHNLGARIAGLITSILRGDLCKAINEAAPSPVKESSLITDGIMMDLCA
jgi:hypothetical protein